MRPVAAFIAGVVGLVLGLVAVWALVAVGIANPDLFASRVTVLVALLPALAGFVVMDRGAEWILAQRRLTRRGS